MDQGGGQGSLLLHPVTVGINWIVSGIAQLEEFEQFLATAFYLPGIDFIQVADKPKQLTGGELGIQIGGIREIPADCFSLQRLVLQIETRYLNGAGSGLEQSDDYLDRSGFSCSIGAEKTEYFPGSDMKRDLINSGFLTEALDQVLGLDKSGVGVWAHGFDKVRQRIWFDYTCSLGCKASLCVHIQSPCDKFH